MKLNNYPENYGILSLIQESNLNELRLIRQNLGKRLHEVLSQNPAKNKLALNSGLAPGIANDALASNNGSSKYLIGGFVKYSEKDIIRISEKEAGLLAEKLAQEDFYFYKSAEIGDVGIVAGCHGYASGRDAGKMLIYAGNSSKTSHKLIDVETNEWPGTKQHRQAIQEASAILTLEEILSIMNQTLTSEEITNSSRDDLEKEPLLPEIRQLELENQKIWERMVPLLKSALKGGKLSIGESFTSGILGQIFTSVEGATNLFDWNLNWYDPRLKQFVGVPAKNVTEELIAEPETIALASTGLLNKAPSSTKIALGTTGWANYWVKDQADYFSIGIASKLSNSQIPTVSTAKVQVNTSSTHEKNRGRRQLTRHLGATTVLYLLSDELAKESDENQEDFKKIAGELESIIKHHATIEIKDYCNLLK